MLAERLPGHPAGPPGPSGDGGHRHPLPEQAVRTSLTELIRRPPFESPHHTATAAAIDRRWFGPPRARAPPPGPTAACCSWTRRRSSTGQVLDALRQPLESGRAGRPPGRRNRQLPRAVPTGDGRQSVPVRASPDGKGLDCTCTPIQTRRYFGRLSGRLLDRIDLQMTLQRISLADIAAGDAAESSSKVAARVHAARAAQRERLARWGLDVNAEAGASLLKKELKPPRQVTADLDRAMDLQVLTGRGYSRVLRVAWTVADLRGLPSPDRDCVGTALAFRQQVNAA